MCIDVEWEISCLCFMPVKEARAELPYSRFRNGICDVCLDDVETLSLQYDLWNIHRPQELEIHLSTERFEIETEKMVGIIERLWLFYSLSSW